MRLTFRSCAVLGVVAFLGACKPQRNLQTQSAHADSVGLAAFRFAKEIKIAGDPPERPQPTGDALDLLIALGWSGTKMPDGYNDAQPFAAPSGSTEAASLMAWALASPYLPGYDRVAKFNKKAVLVAVLDVRNAPSGNALGVVNGAYCVFLQHAAAGSEDGPTSWTAWITGLKNSNPLEGCADLSSTTPVPVFAVGGFSGGDVPPAVRLVSTNGSSGLALGIKCAKLWCEIGVTAASYKKALSDGAYPGAGKKARIKGWHDEQELWMWGTGGKLVPSTIYASVIPDEQIEDHDEAYYSRGSANDFYPAVTVFIPPGTSLGKSGYGDDPNPYSPNNKKGWGFSPGANVIGLHFDGKLWTAALLKPGQAPVPLKVSSYMDHPSIPLPGTTRWYWTTKDEIIWMPCAEGCCTVETDTR